MSEIWVTPSEGVFVNWLLAVLQVQEWLLRAAAPVCSLRGRAQVPPRGRGRLTGAARREVRGPLRYQALVCRLRGRVQVPQRGRGRLTGHELGAGSFRDLFE